MTKILQFIVVFLDLIIALFLFCAPLIIIAFFFQQLYIRMQCKYRGFREKPGRACVICKYHEKCSRACESKDYVQYVFCRASHPEQAQGLFDKIRAEEESKPK